MSKRKTPTLRFKGFNNDWEQRKFSKLYFKSKEKNDLSFSKNQKISLATMKWSKISDNSSKKYMKSYNVFRMGDIAFEGNKSKNFQFGRFVENDLGNGIVSHVFDVYRPINKSKHDIRFWKYYIHNEKVMRNILRKSTTSATMMHNLVNKDILRQKLIIPNFKEMKSIGSILEKMDLNVDLQKRKYEELKLLKKALMQNMFANTSFYPKLRFKGFIYKCEQYKLSDLGYTFSGLSGKSKKDFGHGKAQYITYMNVFSNPIANLKMTEHIEIDNKQNSVKYNDIFFTTSSETPEEVGMSSIWLGREANTYLNSFCFGFRPSTKIDSYYIAFMLRSPSFRQKIMILAQGISRFNISKNKVMNIKISLPKISEQREIGITIKKIDNIVKLQTEFINQSKKLKNFLLQNMFI